MATRVAYVPYSRVLISELFGFLSSLTIVLFLGPARWREHVLYIGVVVAFLSLLMTWRKMTRRTERVHTHFKKPTLRVTFGSLALAISMIIWWIVVKRGSPVELPWLVAALIAITVLYCLRTRITRHA